MSKNLVCYFSVTGFTGQVAEQLAKAVDGELFAIEPALPYTESDINYLSPLARCNREKMGKKDVEIAAYKDSLDGYNLIYIGFPIWYWGAPNIVNTFVKHYDWTGKKVALFATSGGSDISKAAVKLAPFMKGNPEIVGARLFNDGESEEEMKAWAREITA